MIKFQSNFIKGNKRDYIGLGQMREIEAAAAEKAAQGKIERQEHVMNCRLSAYHAAKSALDSSFNEKYDYLPYFYSRVFDLSWVFYGFNEGTAVEFGKKEPGEMFGCFWVSNKKVWEGLFQCFIFFLLFCC